MASCFVNASESAFTLEQCFMNSGIGFLLAFGIGIVAGFRCMTRTGGGSLGGAPGLDQFGGGGRTRTYDLRIMRCAFGRAATWIQPLAFGTRDLSWN
jgi:hypothetical protein